MADVDTTAGTDTGATPEAGTPAAPDASTQAPGTLLTDKPGEGAGADAGKGDGADGNGDTGKEGAEAAAYTLTAPEGFPISDGALKGLNDVCQSAKLSEEQAKAVMSYMQGNYSTAVAARQEAMQAQAKTWIGEFQADKEFGGDKFDASVADAQRALATFDKSGTVGKMLAETGYGNNPEVLRIFARVGKALGEDKPSGNGGGADAKPLEERMYPNWRTNNK